MSDWAMGAVDHGVGGPGTLPLPDQALPNETMEDIPGGKKDVSFNY